MSTDDVLSEERLRALSVDQRREILTSLADAETATLDELANDLTAVARPDGGSGPADVAARLHHVHLPVLDESGLVDYDHRNRTVRYCPDRDVEVVLSHLSTDQSPE